MTMIAYLTNSFMYCKVANSVLWFFAFKPYGLFFMFLFLCALVVLRNNLFFIFDYKHKGLCLMTT